MKEIKIQFDYLHGPLWKDVFDAETGEWRTGMSCVDNDETIQKLNDEAQELYESLYSFDPGSGGCRFDTERLSQIRSRLLSLARALVDRLNTLNDGSFSMRIMLEDLARDEDDDMG